MALLKFEMCCWNQSWISGWFKLLLLYLLFSSLPSPSIWKCQIKAVAHQFPPTPAMLILMNSDVLRLLGIRGQNLIIFLLRIRISDCLIGHWVKAGLIRILDETFLWYFFIVELKVNNCSQCYSCQSISNSELKTSLSFMEFQYLSFLVYIFFAKEIFSLISSVWDIADLIKVIIEQWNDWDSTWQSNDFPAVKLKYLFDRSVGESDHSKQFSHQILLDQNHFHNNHWLAHTSI